MDIVGDWWVGDSGATVLAMNGLSNYKIQRNGAAAVPLCDCERGGHPSSFLVKE